MPTPIITALGATVMLAAAAAISDIRFGIIPNWLSIPPIFLAPVVYASSLGFGYGMQSVGAAFVAGIGPYTVFRFGGMGGGDVKLFAALGAVAAFDPMAGLRIQLHAFVVALLVAFSLQALHGKLGVTVRALLLSALNLLVPTRRHLRSAMISKTPIRMGAPILAGTLLALSPHLTRALRGG